MMPLMQKLNETPHDDLRATLRVVLPTLAERRRRDQHPSEFHSNRYDDIQIASSQSIMVSELTMDTSLQLSCRRDEYYESREEEHFAMTNDDQQAQSQRFSQDAPGLFMHDDDDVSVASGVVASSSVRSDATSNSSGLRAPAPDDDATTHSHVGRISSRQPKQQSRNTISTKDDPPELDPRDAKKYTTNNTSSWLPTRRKVSKDAPELDPRQQHYHHVVVKKPAVQQQQYYDESLLNDHSERTATTADSSTVASPLPMEPYVYLPPAEEVHHDRETYDFLDRP